MPFSLEHITSESIVVVNIADPSRLYFSISSPVSPLREKIHSIITAVRKNVNLGVEIRAVNNRHVFYIDEEACCVVTFVSVGASGVSTQQIHAMCKPVA